MKICTQGKAAIILIMLTAVIAASCLPVLCMPVMDPPEYRVSEVFGFNSEFADPTATSTLINTLADNNFNVVMPEIRKAGDAYYNSAYEPWGSDVQAGYDPLADVLTKAHAKNMQVFGWIVTYRIWTRGKTAPTTHIWSKHPEWATIDTSGRNYIGNYYNLDPGIPGVEDYVVGVVKDIVAKYPTLDGFNFDYVRYDSTSVGYNPIAKARFKAEYGYDPPTTVNTSNPQWQAWSEWKRRQVTDLVKRCYLEAIYINPRIKMTADTIGWMGGNPVTDFTGTPAYSQVCQDSKGWLNQHFLDIIMLMNYKRDWTGLLASAGYKYKGYSFGNQQADHRLWSDYLKQTQASSGRHCIDTIGGYMNMMQGILDQSGYSRNNGLGLSSFRYGFDLGQEDSANPGLPVFNTGTSTVAGPTAALENTYYSTMKSTMFRNPAPVPAMPWKDSPTKGYLFGQVVNAHNQIDPVYGGWIYNIPVTATDSSGNVFTAITDATGTYGFIDLEPGNYRVSISVSGYDPIHDYPATISAGLATKLDLQLNPILPLKVAVTWPTSSPTYVTQGPAVTIGGTIVGNEGGKRVKWASNRGGEADCALSGTNWISGPISLSAGANVITVTAADAGGNTDTVTLTVTSQPPVFVSTSGNDANDGSSWALAKKTVQAGLDAAASGQQVWVAAGTYNERITLKQNVHLYGGFAGVETDMSQRNVAVNATTLAGGAAGPVVSCANISTGQPTIDGFTITNGLSLDGGGIYCDASSPTIRNNTITGNSAQDYGGAIYCRSGSPTIANNTITDNSADWLGGGIYCSASSPTITNNSISGNSASRYGGGIYCDASSPAITNNTINDNTAPSHGGGLYCMNGSSPTVSNNIVAFNSSGIFQSGGSPTLRNNCVYGNTTYGYSGLAPGTGDIATDPLFLNTLGEDYHLTSSSLCINAGWNSAPGMTLVDMDGDPRITGTAVDIGADESSPLPMTASEAKKKDPSASVYLPAMIVTATSPDFFYAEAADRSSGIRVDKPGHGLIPGMSASIYGAVNTDSAGETHIDAGTVINTGYGRVRPLALAGRDLGCGDWFYNPSAGAGQDLVKTYRWVKSGGTLIQQLTDGAGLNNIGLLVTAFGKVTYATAGFFYIDDGSQMDDGSGHIGIKVLGSVPYPSPSGKYVKVTGISSCFKGASPSTDLYRQVLATDVAVVQ